jgi:hypothetical protein
MESLYDKDGRYTEVAEAIDIKAGQILKPLFAQCVELGYSPREVAHIITATVTEMELSAILGWG